jgi:transposase InsO family protein
VDFKGNFRTQDGSKCYPLTIIDAYSPFLIRCEVVEAPDGREVQRIFDSAFSEFGLPAASVSASSALSPASRSRTDDKSAFTAR